MKKIIRLTESDLTRLIKKIIIESKKKSLRESVTDVEPIKYTKGAAVFLERGLPIGGSKLDPTKSQTFINEAVDVLKASQSAIERFYNDKTFKIPQFIKIQVGTDYKGSEKGNTTTADNRAKAAKDLVLQAFKQSGLGYNATQIEEWLKPSFNYERSNLNSNLYDKNQLEGDPNERYVRITISPVIEMGMGDKHLDALDDIFYYLKNNKNNKPDWKQIIEFMCKLQTYSDITSLNEKMFREDGLQGYLNNLTPGPNNPKTMTWIAGCLNRASGNSKTYQKGYKIAQAVDQDTISIQLD